LSTYTKRTIGDHQDVIESERRKDTMFSFDLEDLTPLQYIAETLSYQELTDFIEKEKSRGSSSIGRYEVVKYRKWSIPVSIFILTIIALAVSSKKRRGGMGVNHFWYFSNILANQCQTLNLKITFIYIF